VVAVLPRATEAHKAVTSKYGYAKDVFPVLRDHCGQCHVAGGPAPMSLLTFKDATAWAEAMRDELTAGRMPPFPASADGPALREAHPMTAHDLDVVVTWASGGAPYGDPKIDVPDTKFEPRWTLGKPDLTLAMDAPHTLAAGVLDDVVDATIPTGLTETRWVKAVDVLPGNPTLARDAVVSVEGGPVVAAWQPGGDTIAAPAGAAFKLAAGAKLHLRMHYKKHFDVEQEAVSDRSTIGLYFADAPASGRELQSVTMNGTGAATALPGPARIVAIRAVLDHPYGSLAVDAVSPAGNRVPLLRLNAPRPQWSRRYWLQSPVEMAGGSRIEVSLTPLPSSIDEPKTASTNPLEIALDYVPE
jgi:hypothetical protein